MILCTIGKTVNKHRTKNELNLKDTLHLKCNKVVHQNRNIKLRHLTNDKQQSKTQKYRIA